VGVAQTFAVLPELPEADAARMLNQALAEPHEPLQGAAVEFILSDRQPARMMMLVAHFPELLPEARRRLQARRAPLIGLAVELIGRADSRLRPAAFQVVAELGDLVHARLLLDGLSDAGARIRHICQTGLKKWIEAFYTHLLQAKKNRERVSVELVQLYRPHACAVVERMLWHFESVPESLWVKTAIELGPASVPVLLERVLEKPGSPLYAAFVTYMQMSHSAEATDLLLQMCADRSPRARGAAEEICARRRDPAFGHELAARLGALEPAAAAELAERMITAPWWEPALLASDLTEPELAVLARALCATRIEAQEKQQRLRALLAHPSAGARAVGLAELERLEAPDLLALGRAALADPDSGVVLAAARMLARRGAPDLASLMAPHVKSPHLELSQLALRVIADESFKRYVSAFDQLDEATRQRAAQAISRIDGSLIDRLRAEIESLEPERRFKALRIVDYAGKEDELRPILMDLLYDSDVKVRSAAVKTIQLTASVEGMRLLIDALNDPDRRVRANALEALEHAADTRFIGLIKPFLDDPDNRVRGNAAKALYRLGVLEARATLEEMLRSPDRLMRLSAAWAIAELAAPELRPLAEQRLKQEQDPRVIKRLREALGEAAS
jgi:hypothetical protein